MRADQQAKSIVEVFRHLRGDYDAARQTRFKRRRQGVIPTGSGADYHYRTESAYFGMMETARDLFRNHCLIGQGVRRVVANILRGGFTLDVKTGDEAIDRDNVARWNAWASDPEQCDLTGEQNFHGLERLTLQSIIVDGDILSLPTESGAVQLVEAHRLRTPRSTKKNVVHGVLLDDFRRRLEYWITKEDIDAMAPVPRVSDVTQYPTRDRDGNRQVLHHYLPDRVSQTRGITAFAPAVDTASQGDDLFFAQLVKAQMAACVTLLRELAENSQVGIPGSDQETTTEPRPTGMSRMLAGWQPGMEIFGWPGEKLQGFAPNVPNAEFFQHAGLILTIVAVNLDLPLAVFLLDPSKTNFSGWRGAIDQARQRFQAIQAWLSSSFHTPIYRWQVRRWMAEDPALQRAAARGVDVFGHRWHAPTWPYIEPVQDAMGDVVQERNLLNSHRRLLAARGLDSDDITTEIVEDRAQFIQKAHEMAEQLNKQFGLDLTWRDIAQWPMPEGVTLSIGNQITANGGNDNADQQ
jgi:lambda family phage portal protein